MYLSSGGGNGKGNIHPSQQTMPTSAITPVIQQNGNIQQQMYPNGAHPLVLPHFPSAFLPCQPTPQLYATPPLVHIPQNQMAAGFNNLQCFIANPLIPSQPPPNLIQGHIAHNSNVLAFPSMNVVQGNALPRAPYASGTTPNLPIKHFKSTKPRKHAIAIINPVTMKNILEEDQKLVSSENCTSSVNADDLVGENSIGEPLSNGKLENTEKIGFCVKPQFDKTEMCFKKKFDKGKQVIEAKNENSRKILKDFCTSTSFYPNEGIKNHQSISVEKNSSNTIAHSVESSDLNKNIEDMSKQSSGVLENPKKEHQQNHTIFKQSGNLSKSIVNETESVSHFKTDTPEKPRVIGKNKFPFPNSQGTRMYPNFGKEYKRKMHNAKRKKIHTHQAEAGKTKCENCNSFENRANSKEVDINSNKKQQNVTHDETKEKQIFSSSYTKSNLENIEAVISSSSAVIFTTSYDNKSESNCNDHITVTEDKKPTEGKILEGNTQMKTETIIDTSISKNQHFTKRNELHQLIRYNEDQWSPWNLLGKKYYDIGQLYALYNSPMSHKIPKLNQKVYTLFVENPRSNPMPLNSSIKKTLKNSQFLQENNWETDVQYSALGIARSTGGRSPLKPTKSSGNIYVRLSLKENVNLKESENAWKPTRFQLKDNLSAKALEKEELFRKIRGILNKLTPEKFDKLLEEIMKLQIDTAEKMNGVMMLVFEKAIDEPNFSASYARLCHRLADKNLQCEIQGANTKSSNLVLFKTSLLDKTEHEFHDNVIDLQAKNAKLKPIIDSIKNCVDPKKKLELQTVLEEKEFQLRKRSCGTVRFIGELFKMSMLTGSIIKTCINKLLDSKSEQKLECLCKLLTTVGKTFELTPVHRESKTCHSLDDLIQKMQNIADKKVEGGKVSNRVRFMLQDVIELRKNKWISTNTENQKHLVDLNHSERQTVGGKKCEKSIEMKMSNWKSNNVGADYFYTKSNVHNSSQEMWNNQPTKLRQSVDPSKLRQIFNPENPIKLGDSSQFMWRREKQNFAASNFSNKMYVADLQTRRPSTRGSYNKEEILPSTMPTSASMIRSTSQNDLAHLNMTKLKKFTSVTAINLLERSKEDENIASSLDITNECSEKVRDTLNKMVDILLEDPVETCTDIWIQLPIKFHWVVVFNIFSDYLHLAKTKTPTRKALSNIILFLLDNNYLKQKDLSKGYVEFSKIAHEIVIDVPEAWKYIFEFIGDAIYRNILPINFFWNEYLFESGMGKQFLTHFVSYFTTEYDLNCVQNLWFNSKLQLKSILNEQDIPIFLEKQNFKFIQNEVDDLNLNADSAEIKKYVLQLLQNGSNADSVINYLIPNVATINTNFVNFLTKILVDFSTNHETCVLKTDLFEEICIPLLRRYIDLKEDLEIECLNTIADYVRDVKGNSVVLINTLFSELHETEVISENSFIKWSQHKLNTNTDNVLLLGLNSFLCSLDHSTIVEN